MRKFRKYTATALVAMMVAGMTMSGYQPADVSASQESEYIIVTKDKKSMKTVESKYNTMIDTQEQNTDFLKDENVLVSKMTAKEADIVNKDQKVVSVERTQWSMHRKQKVQQQQKKIREQTVNGI